MSQAQKDRVRRPGRPRTEEPGSSISAWVPSSQHDRLIQLARSRGMTVSEYIRVIVRHATTAR